MSGHKTPKFVNALLTEDAPFQYKEAYNHFRTNLRFSMAEKNFKRLLVTSAIAGEGKTTVAINTAQVLAEAGARVILVDCDMRNPSVARRLGLQVNEGAGLAAVLSEQSTIESALFHINQLNIDVLAGGAVPANPSELISTSRMQIILNTFDNYAEYVVSAVKQILEVCPQGAVLIIESTISPGTIEKQIRPIIKAAGKKIGHDVYLAHAPERIIPGNMIYELQHNSRTIGADSRQIAERVRNLYATFCRGEIVLTDIRSAELSKVVENAYRAVNIAFANELSIICGHENIDVSELIRICNKHPRVNILNPGPGVGGHCISIDPWFLVGEYGEDAALTRCAMETNRRMPKHELERIQKVMQDNDLEDFNQVGLYGLAYKENVDDCRESPTLQLLAEIKKTGSGTPAVYDPMVLSDLVPHQCHTMDEFLFHSSIVVIMVKHAEILNNMDMLAGKIIIDCHHICKLENTVYL